MEEQIHEELHCFLLKLKSQGYSILEIISIIDEEYVWWNNLLDE